MPDKNSKLLDKYRSEIAESVRRLRRERRWSQAELAKMIGVSQGRLSNLERGAGSFTAEQMLLLMQLLNVPASTLVSSPRRTAPDAELQNALARWGASHLRESDDVLPSEKLDEIHGVVRETLLAGDPRHITALAPIIVLHGHQLGMGRLDKDLKQLGFDRRLPWLAENILLAIRQLRTRTLPRNVVVAFAGIEALLDMYLKLERWRLPEEALHDAPFDLLDPGIRSKRTLDELVARASEPSRRWRIATRLEPADFANAVEAALAGT